MAKHPCLSRPALAVVATAVLSSSCAYASNVPSGAQPVVEPNQGLVVLVVDTDVPLDSLTFYNEETAADIRVPRADRGVSEFLFVAPAGVYRLTNYRSPHALFDAAAAGQRSVCLVIEAGALSDPGQFQHRETGEGNGWTKRVRHRWNPNADDTRKRLAERWPEVAGAQELRPTSCPRR